MRPAVTAALQERQVVGVFDALGELADAEKWNDKYKAQLGEASKLCEQRNNELLRAIQTEMSLKGRLTASEAETDKAWDAERATCKRLTTKLARMREALEKIRDWPITGNYSEDHCDCYRDAIDHAEQALSPSEENEVVK